MDLPTSGDLLPASLAVDMLPMKKALCPESPSSGLGFPSEFPFEFNSFSPAFTSPSDSTETEDESSDDEEDFLAGLTRRLALSAQRLPPTYNDRAEEKRQAVSTSPQSTLSGFGSWSASGSGSPNGPSSQVPSPPTTPFRKDDAWDVISAAAGQVAKLKMGGGAGPFLSRPNLNPNILRRHAPAPEPIFHHHGKPQNAAFVSDLEFQQIYSHSNQSSQIMRGDCASIQQSYADWVLHPKSSCYQSQFKFKSPDQPIPSGVSSVFGRENSRCLRPVMWLRSPPSPPQPPQQGSSAWRNGFPVGSGAKRPCAGTGVFLPRRISNQPDSRKKSGNSSVVFQSKVVHPQNQSIDEFKGCLSSGPNQFECESLMARRSGLMVRQGGMRPIPDVRLNQERPLPQEWMY